MFKMIQSALVVDFGLTKSMLNVTVSFLGNPGWNLFTFKLGGEALV